MALDDAAGDASGLAGGEDALERVSDSLEVEAAAGDKGRDCRDASGPAAPAGTGAGAFQVTPRKRRWQPATSRERGDAEEDD